MPQEIVPAKGHDYENGICKNCGKSEPKPSDGLSFELNSDNKSYTVTGIGECTDKDIVIPSKYNGLSVTGIGEEAFLECSSLTSIAIPNSIISIGNYAFDGCRGLKAVYIEDMTSWCNITFSDEYSNPLSYTKNLYLNNELVTDLAIPNNITQIKAYAFINCESLKSITIPDSVSSIGKSAFDNCSNIEKATIPALAISYMPKNNLRTVIITSGKSIDKYTFENCNSLTRITIGDSITDIGESAFNGCSNLVSVTIGDGVSSIGWCAFMNCSKLTSITIGTGLTSISSYAFSGCSNLKAVYIKDIKSWCNITYYNYYHDQFGLSNPLYYAKNLYLNNKLVTDLIIPNDVTEIKSYAFAGCNMASIAIPDSVKSIGNNAFYNCYNLQYNEYDNAFYLGNEENPYHVLINVKDKSIKSFKVNEKTGIIYDNAFYGCSNLTSLTIHDNVTSIGSSAFSNCYKLVEVYNLSSLNIEKGSTDNGHIGYYALNVYTPNSGEKKTFETDDGYIFYEDGYICYLLGYKENEKELTLPKDCNGKTYEIYKYAFYNTDITGITIPDSVTSIGDYAFSGCDNIETAIIPTIAISSMPKNKIKTVVITSGESISSYAFKNCSSLTSITIPDSVTSIGSYAFSNCNNLKYNEYDNGLYLGNKGNPYYVLIKAKDKSITSYTINEKTGIIYYSAFSNCSNLTSVTIPDGVTSIGNNAFTYCSSLTSITIPDSVTSIDSYAFEYCSSLTSITIPDSVTSINHGAFWGCSNLKSLYYKGSTSDWSKISISWDNSDLTLATRYYYSESKPTGTGNYWHYDADGNVVVW